VRASHGALTLLDFVGLDTTYYISQIMFDECKERAIRGATATRSACAGRMEWEEVGAGFMIIRTRQKTEALKF